MPLTTYTAGQVLTASSLNANLSFAAGAGGLTLISRTTQGPVASIAYDDVFTSTYKTYMVVIEDLVGTTSADVHIQFRYAGPTTQATTYYYAGRGIDTTNGSADLYGANTSQGVWQTVSTSSLSGTMQFFNVGNSSATPRMVSSSISTSGNVAQRTIAVINSTARIYTGFLLKLSTGNITATVSIYGVTAS